VTQSKSQFYVFGDHKSQIEFIEKIVTKFALNSGKLTIFDSNYLILSNQTNFQVLEYGKIYKQIETSGEWNGMAWRDNKQLTFFDGNFMKINAN
jgi:hypothetical protein